MELYADSQLQTRVMLGVDTRLSAAEVQAPPTTFPLLLFTVKVEQWSGAQREEIENIQLQSLEGKSVSHDYYRRVPRWVDAASKEGEPGPLDNLKTLDFSQGTPTVQAGEAFAIPAKPTEDKKGQPQEATAPAPRKIVWQEESYHLTLLPLAFEEDVLRLKVGVSGQFLDRTTHQLLQPIQTEVEKALLAEQPIPFYLTRETVGGPEGYVVGSFLTGQNPSPGQCPLSRARLKHNRRQDRPGAPRPPSRSIAPEIFPGPARRVPCA